METALSHLELAPKQVAQLPGNLGYRVVDFLLRWEQYEAALECLDELISLRPNLPSLLDDRARALLALKRYEEALEAMRLRHQIRIVLTSQALVARIHLARGDTVNALAIAQKLTIEEPESLTAWSLMSEVRLARKEYADALAACNRLHSLRPNGRAYLMGMLALHQAQGDWVTASAYAVRLERSTEEGVGLPAYTLRRLRDYYRASHEPNRAADQETVLAQLYRAELSELEASIERGQTKARPAQKKAPPAEPIAAPSAEPQGEPLPTLENIFVADEVRSQLEKAAREIFGFERLLPGQAESMALLLRGQDVLTILPTGGGKSLCYQLPALMDESGLTLVISPLIALMKDQVDSLPSAVRFKATTINSSLDGDELRHRLRELASGRYRLVYAAPERLRQLPFLHALRRVGVNRLVIDEAHCVSIWGHDFRPDYLHIHRARQALGNPPVLAMTATAPPRVRSDILQRIGTAQAGQHSSMSIVTTGVGRPNLYLEVIRVRNADEKLQHLLAICQEEAGSGIVYVNSRERSEHLAELLSNQGIAAGYYHAGIGDRAARDAAQDTFMCGDVRVMVATVAFGMGIDKPDIRFILHFDLPTSLEAYYQEAGRAGRDGLPARCTILYAPADRGTLTVHAKRDALSIETLRAIYSAVKSRLEGACVGRVAMGDLQRDVQAEETTVRVALSMLEEVGLLRRHQDAPRTAVVSLLMDQSRNNQSDPDLLAFVSAAKLRRGDRLPIDLLQVARGAGLNPLSIEERLLAWSDAGCLTYQPVGRELLLEILPPPQDAAARIAAQLERYATIQLQRIDEIIAYAKTSRCRHGHISAYLSGRAASTCQSCDNCTPRRPVTAEAPAPNLPDEREQIMAILRCVATAPWSWGRMNLVRILRGDPAAPEQGKESCAWGALAFRSQSAISASLDRLVQAGLLQPRQLSNGGTVLDITDAGRSALADRAKLAALMFPEPSERSPKIDKPKATQDIPTDDALFEALRVWRRDVATQAGVPAYCIAHDALLRRIAALRPTTAAQLRAIRGMGSRKLAQYGAAILEVVKRTQS